MGRGRGQLDTRSVLFAPRNRPAFAPTHQGLLGEAKTFIDSDFWPQFWKKLEALEEQDKENIISKSYFEIIEDSDFKKLYEKQKEDFSYKNPEGHYPFNVLANLGTTPEEAEEIFRRFFVFSLKENLQRNLDGEELNPVFFNRPLLYNSNRKRKRFRASTETVEKVVAAESYDWRKRKDVVLNHILPNLLNEEVVLEGGPATEKPKRVDDNPFSFNSWRRSSLFKGIATGLFEDSAAWDEWKIPSPQHHVSLYRNLLQGSKEGQYFQSIFDETNIRQSFSYQLWKKLEAEEEKPDFDPKKHLLSEDDLKEAYISASKRELKNVFCIAVSKNVSNSHWRGSQAKRIDYALGKLKNKSSMLRRIKPLYLESDYLGDEKERKEAWQSIQKLFKDPRAEKLTGEDIEGFFCHIVDRIFVESAEIYSKGKSRSIVLEDINKYFDNLLNKKG